EVCGRNIRSGATEPPLILGEEGKDRSSFGFVFSPSGETDLETHISGRYRKRRTPFRHSRQEPPNMAYSSGGGGMHNKRPYDNAPYQGGGGYPGGGGGGGGGGGAEMKRSRADQQGHLGMYGPQGGNNNN
ncbi:unnamed protein product, partial [Scytosiphon promiscuus]